jgi:glycosyltransferase involved in cell wall biosynthesis
MQDAFITYYNKAIPNFKRPFGFNVIGYVSANLGLGVTARNSVKLLLDKGFPVAIYDLDPGFGRSKHDLSFEEYTVKSVDDLPYAVNFIVLPPPELPKFFQNIWPSSLSGEFLNVGFVFWELTVLPRIWTEALQLLDIAVAPTTFIRNTFDTNLSDIHTILAAHSVYLPSGIEPSRTRFGLPENSVIFIFSFEPQSDLLRKNPYAIIDAFTKAFKESTSAHLVIKLNNTKVDGVENPIVKTLKEYVEVLPQVLLIEDIFTYQEVLSLYASCDVFVSLHRAEGLGLGLMESMALGKAVIATAWSGNMTFMDHTNSCLVRYKLIPVEASLYVYQKKCLGKDAIWADPDVEDAAAWMKKLADDPGLRSSIGKKAAEDIASFHEQAKKGHFLEEIIAVWNAQTFLPARREKTLINLLRAQVAHDVMQLSRKEKIRRQVKDFLNKRLLWRFKK